MAESYPHLRLLREQPVNPRRSRPAPIRIPEPANPRAFGAVMGERLASARERTAQDLGGFDDRRLIKLELDERLDPDTLKNITREMELVSQEDKSVVLAFATEAALAEFEQRLATLARGGRPRRREILYALKGFDAWTEADRTGWALRQEGWPQQAQFSVDVELWPVATPTERQSLWQAFEAWLREENIERLDAVKQAALLLYRVKVNREQAERLLRHRDVRTLDLPPRWGLDIQMLGLDLQDLPPLPEPPAEASGIAVLDSGVLQNHPLLAPAIGDAQSFVPGLTAEDEHGHGTQVAGIALYGDVAACAETRSFVPSFRLFSGRVLDANNEADTRLIENAVEEAVRYFHQHYGCRVFNFSYGDQRKPYRGGHVRGLAVTLDSLARELGVLFVVPTGNFMGDDTVPADWGSDYPDYLLGEEATLLDPAPALNALTVGGIARWDATFNTQRYQDDPAEQPIARHDQPAPFTRSGPSVGGAIKPELVDYAGNWAVNRRSANQWIVKQGLGELSTGRETAAGRLLAEATGTSFAAPEIAHLAAHVLAEHPQADANLLRALLVAHARWPQACEMLLPAKQDRLRLCGYGRTDSQALTRSDEQEVTLIAEESLPDRSHHFYELPVPEAFWEGGRRNREITVALAYSSAVRTTRVAYKGCRIDFRLVGGPDLQQVSRMFNAATSRDDYERIDELNGAQVGKKNRGAGTVQMDRWRFRQPSTRRRDERLFVVVTRNDHPWAREMTLTAEPYALVVVVRDRENATARLYTQVQARLAARVRPRVRV